MVRIHLLAPIIALSLWLITPVGVLGQGPADRDLRSGPTLDYPSGLSVDTGAGAFAIRDENISGQRYAGTLPFTDLTWARDHGRYIYRVGIELGQADDITNRSISSDITRFALGQAFLYPLAPRSFLGRDLSLFLGPATGLALLVNEQHLAVDALGFSTSVVGLLHLGLQADALLPLSERLTAHGSLRSSVLSLGLRGVDDEIDDSSPVKPLTLLTGADTSLELGIRYHISGRFALRLAYRFQLLRVTAWNPVLAASDNLLGYVFLGDFHEDYLIRDFPVAMAHLRETRGLIIDIRQRVGGTPSNIAAVVSRFLTSPLPLPPAYLYGSVVDWPAVEPATTDNWSTLSTC